MQPSRGTVKTLNALIAGAAIGLGPSVATAAPGEPTQLPKVGAWPKRPKR